jgi:hypothetical protein
MSPFPEATKLPELSLWSKVSPRFISFAEIACHALAAQIDCKSGELPINQNG